MGYRIRQYVAKDRKSPYRDWVDSLDTVTRAKIQARVLRFELGNLGDYASVGKGVLEARFMFGPGYRLYFGMHEKKLVLLLLGGDKRSQKKDIKQAQEFWRDFLEQEGRGKKK